MSTEASTEASTEVTYKGNCHCGLVRFTTTLPWPIDSGLPQVIECNCSICVKNGYLLVHLPFSATKITHGEDRLTHYKFGTKSVDHKFCPTCGGSVFITLPELYNKMAVNIRNFEDVDVSKITTIKVDGKARGDPYSVPTPEDEKEEEKKEEKEEKKESLEA